MKNNVADLFGKYQRRLQAFIRDRVPEREDAEDILQDVFLRLIQTEETSPVVQVSGWLYQVARNTIIDRRRKNKEERMPQAVTLTDDGHFVREVTEVLLAEGESPDRVYLRALVWEELESALAELPCEQRLAFERTELDGMTFKELSAETGISVETLLSRKHYAVKFLRERLKEVYEALLYDE